MNIYVALHYFDRHAIPVHVLSIDADQTMEGKKVLVSLFLSLVVCM